MSESSMYFLYSLLLACVAVVSLPWWGVQLLRLKKYRAGFKERIGLVPVRLKRDPNMGCIWVHAVSVGEVLAVSQLVTELKKAFPAHQIFVSTTTLTGQQLARQRFGEENVFYLPLDFGFALRPYLRFLRPELLVLAETELWPNLLHLARRSGAGIAIVNARISDRSFPRYRRFRFLFSRVLSSVHLFLAQTPADAERLVRIGATADTVQVSGNLKFDIKLSAGSPLVAELQQSIGSGPVIVCGSTTAGEEELVLSAFDEVITAFPSTVLVLAVRHPQRFDKVAMLVENAGFKLVRRTSWPGSNVSLAGKVFLLDTVGELASIYELADVAFVGGSLVPMGGHNILEPAQHGVAIVTGPHTFNFREITRIFAEAGAVFTVTPENLGNAWLKMLKSDSGRAMGVRAKALFQQNTGATGRTLSALVKLSNRTEPRL